MKASQCLYATAVLAAICALAVVRPFEAAAADPLISREGDTISVIINGVKTTRIKAREIVDKEGREAFTVNWTADLKGPGCYYVQPHDSRLGEAERINILIHEINPERESQRWKSYDTVPEMTEYLASIQTKEGFCPKEYTLTERLRYPKLPAGQYVFRIAYWGKGNWDRQDILVTVSE